MCVGRRNKLYKWIKVSVRHLNVDDKSSLPAAEQVSHGSAIIWHQDIKHDKLLLEDMKYLHGQQVYSFTLQYSEGFLFALNCSEVLAQKAKKNK